MKNANCKLKIIKLAFLGTLKKICSEHFVI